jgi:hypothetical protein
LFVLAFSSGELSMMFIQRIRGAAVIGALMFLGAGLAAPAADASTYVLTFRQQGSDVVATGSGTIDLTGLTFDGESDAPGRLTAASAIAIAGVTGFAPADSYTGFTGPATLGSGSATFADLGSGNTVGVAGAVGLLFVPLDYASGDSLSSSATFEGQTFASLGVTPGTYQWTWGPSGAPNELVVAVGVPEPSSFVLVGLPLGLMLLLAARRGLATVDGAYPLG